MQKSVLSFITRSSIAFAVLCVAVPAGAAPLSYTGGTYSQNFDTLPTNVTNPSQTITGKGPHDFSKVTGATGLAGWEFGNLGGSSSSTEFRSHNGSLGGSSGRGMVSHGTNGSTERALGAQVTSNQIPSFGLVIKNDTGNLLTSFTLDYTGEQWRRGDVSTPNVLTFAYSVGSSAINSGTFTTYAPLSFDSPNTQNSPTEVGLDGNLASNQMAKSATVTGLNWLPGQTLTIKWTMSEQSGQDDGLAVDNLNFSAVPEPSSLALAMIGLIGTTGVVIRRRRHAN